MTGEPAVSSCFAKEETALVTMTMTTNTDTVAWERILRRTGVRGYEDRAFADVMERVLYTMFTAKGATVRGVPVSGGQLRKTLSMLTADHLDYVQEKLKEGTEPVVAGERYLLSCLYNAPADMLLKKVRYYG